MIVDTSCAASKPVEEAIKSSLISDIWERRVRGLFVFRGVRAN
jgi:hypothetical protein